MRSAVAQSQLHLNLTLLLVQLRVSPTLLFVEQLELVTLFCPFSHTVQSTAQSTTSPLSYWQAKTVGCLYSLV